MARLTSICALVVALTCSVFSQTKPTSVAEEYRSPDNKRIVVVPVDNLAGFESHESRVDFYTKEGPKLCSADFSSADGEHGYGVVKAAWSPDGAYFVFSLESSGGHSPWHTPTMFFSDADRQLCSLDAFLEDPGITTPEFELIAPDSVRTSVYGAKSTTTVSLSSLMRAGESKGRDRCVPCTGGNGHEYGDTTH